MVHGLEPLFEFLYVRRHLSAGLRPHQEGYEQFSDAVPGEVDRDGHPGSPVICKRLDGHIDRGSDRAVDAPDTPTVGWIDVSDLGGHETIGEPDPPGSGALVAD